MAGRSHTFAWLLTTSTTVSSLNMRHRKKKLITVHCCRNHSLYLYSFSVYPLDHWGKQGGGGKQEKTEGEASVTTSCSPAGYWHPYCGSLLFKCFLNAGVCCDTYSDYVMWIRDMYKNPSASYCHHMAFLPSSTGVKSIQQKYNKTRNG